MEGQNRRGTSRAPYIAGLLMWLGFGIIVTEVINKAELIPMRLSAPHMAVSILIAYLGSSWIMRYFERRARRSNQSEQAYRRLKRVSLVLQFLLGLGIMISLPFLWWGVIKELAAQGGKLV
jgi:hypothetical protein